VKPVEIEKLLLSPIGGDRLVAKSATLGIIKKT
jgi:hypothetical protein